MRVLLSFGFISGQKSLAAQRVTERPKERRFDALSYFRQLTDQSKQLQAGFNSSELGIHGVAKSTEKLDQPLRIAKVE